MNMKFNVNVSRSSFSEADFEVEAESYDEAEIKALDLAKNHEFSEYESEYNVEAIDEVS